MIILVATGVIVSAAAGFLLLPRASPQIGQVDRGVPFENLSDEKENAYFGDGMQDDILTTVSKSRFEGDFADSVMSYRGNGRAPPATLAKRWAWPRF